METNQEHQVSGWGQHLGNFLSGMETHAEQQTGGEAVPLGNFLSGMETQCNAEARRAAGRPWKLP